jgi:hypothetical protein
MPDADFSEWHDPLKIAELIKMWSDGVNRPENGTFSILKNQKGMVIPDFV